MENENMVDEETLNLQTESEPNTDGDEQESLDEYKSRLAKAEELANNYKIRAEKAEKLAKGNKPETKIETNNANMPTKDLYALVSAKVHEDDIAEVEEYAKFKGISVAEALKSTVVKTMLSEKEDFRKTALATNTGNVRRGSTKPSDEALLNRARSGDIPDDAEALAHARMEERKKGMK